MRPDVAVWEKSGHSPLQSVLRMTKGQTYARIFRLQGNASPVLLPCEGTHLKSYLELAAVHLGTQAKPG